MSFCWAHIRLDSDVFWKIAAWPLIVKMKRLLLDLV